MKYTSLAFISLFLSGCATSPVTVSESQKVSSDRLLPGYSTLAQASPDRAKVVVIRDAGILGSGLPARLSVDGAPVARLWPSNRVEFYVTSGDHILSVRPEPQLGGALTENSFHFTLGRTYYFRISISENSLRIQPSTQLE
ncbi:MAG: hypothetical protein H0U23_15995 [Blastocatellia bacterium]|nr:hypothetical protein [Blastocatellia bacterium]